jgi:hypothetical protein
VCGIPDIGSKRFRKKTGAGKGVIKMGADLYINSIYQKQRNRYEPKFNHWISVRETYRTAGKKKAVQKAQKKVELYFDKMNGEAGYFRDSYNNTNLLWLFDLSWWRDIGDKLIDREGNLGPDNIKQFLQMLSEREPRYKANLEKVELVGEDTREDVRRYFGNKYVRLKEFLNRALKMNEPVYCSV